MAVTFSFPWAAWARPYVSRRVLYILGTIMAVFLVLFNFAPHTLPPVIAPGSRYSDSSYQSPDKWTPPILSNSKSRPPPEWDANGNCLFLSPFDALTDEEKALAETIELDVVSPGNVRLKNITGTVPSDIKANPILRLLRDGEEKWNNMLHSQSKTLEEAVRKYEEKWQRPPPKGFDQWWLFAHSQNTLLIDEFDSIMESLLPYYGLPKETLAERTKEAEKIVETYTIIVKDGKAEIQWNDDYARNMWPLSRARADDQVNIMEPFLHLLHDFRATFTIHDQPSIQLEHGPQQELIDAALAQKPVKFAHDVDHLERDWKKMCGPDSPLHRGEVETHGPGTFIHDHLLAMDPCTHPSIMEKHGMFLEVHNKDSHPQPHNTLYPIFALSKTALNGDILVTPFFRAGRHDVGYDPKWNDKKAKLYWRGRATGMEHNKGASSQWRHSQRERLHWLANSKSSEPVTIMEPKDASGAARMVNRPKNKLGQYYTDAKLVGGPWQCNRDDGTCDEMQAEIDFAPLEGSDKANEFKYILDLDGNAWSSRFPRLMLAFNVVIKSTVFPEWFSHILPEWFAYVPTKVDYSDLYSIMSFFRGSMDGKGGHDEVARRIALNGQCWAEKTLRYEDLQVYMFRMYLEYARLTSPDRDNGKMDFVLQDYHRDGKNAGEEVGKLEAMPGIDEKRRRQNLLNPTRLCRPGFSYYDPARRRVIHTSDSSRSLAPAVATPPEYDVIATYPQRPPHHATTHTPSLAASLHSDAAAAALDATPSEDVELAEAFFDHAPEEGTHPRSFDDQLPPAPLEEHPTYEEALKKPRRRTRTLEATSPFDAPPIDGPSRFDWRDRRRPKFDVHGLPTWQKWRYPETPRVMPKMTKMNETEGGWAELRRYSDHFVPLLLAEQAEAEAQLENRLASWSDHQLRSEGFMINGLAGSTEWQPRYKVHGVVVSFSRWESDGTKPLPPSQFEPGATVILSRTHPCQDAFEIEDERVKGSVFTISRGIVRVLLPELPEDVEKGTWRIDLGVSDFAIQKQREAIDRLNLDPVLQDQQSSPAALSDQDPEDEALAVTMRRQRPQEILVGTGLRDLILRQFHTHYEPQSAPGSGKLDEIAAQVAEMKPGDMEASTGIEHDDSSPRGILSPNKLIDSWARRYRVPEGRVPIAIEGDPHVPLNPSQTRAIAMMLSERLSLVQGPPGTGKTRVIVETIKLLKQHWQIPHPILVCAHTNVAVDNLVEGLKAQGVNAVRFGSPDRVSPRVESQTLEARIEQHPAYPVLNRARNSKETLQAELSENLAGPLREAKQKEIGKLNGRIYLLKRRIQAEVLHDADVVCTTCLSATSRVLEVIDFPFVFLDEASMATEPLSIVPLTKGSAQVAIIGDHKQLPPVIISEAAQQGGLGTSLFERLIHEKVVPSIMLDTQYRMHPSIAAFSSEAFYNSQLKDGTVVNGQVDPALHPPVTAFLLPDGDRSKSLTFLNHDFPESPQNRSIANHHEAGRVCDIVADLLASNPDLKGADIGVIAPYSAQIRLITEFLTIDERRQRAFRQWLGHERAREIQDIEIRTVDGFEGREKAVIIFSTVRSNTGGFLGFLGDWRRLNVGLTRAKRALIMLGSLRTLSNGVPSATALEKKGIPIDGTRVWKRFVAWLRKNGLVMEDPA